MDIRSYNKKPKIQPTLSTTIKNADIIPNPPVVLSHKQHHIHACSNAALALAEVIASKRNLTLVSFNNLGDGSFQARFNDTPESEGA